MRSLFWKAPLAATLGLAACADGFHSVGFYDKVDTAIAGGRTVSVLGVGDLYGNYGRRSGRPAAVGWAGGA